MRTATRHIETRQLESGGALRYIFTVLVVVAVHLFTVDTVQGTLVLAVDMDPSTSDIETDLPASVVIGTTFSVDVVAFDDGTAPTPTTFDTIGFEVYFNDSGDVLSLGPGGPVAGDLADFSAETFSLFGPSGALTPGVTVLGTGPSSSLPGFASGSGAFTLIDPTEFVVGTGAPVTIATLDFTASAAGTSMIVVEGTPVGSPEAALDSTAIFGAPVVPGVNTGSATVAVPEPSSLAALSLVGMATAAVLGYRRLRVALCRDCRV